MFCQRNKISTRATGIPTCRANLSFITQSRHKKLCFNRKSLMRCAHNAFMECKIKHMYAMVFECFTTIHCFKGVLGSVRTQLERSLKVWHAELKIAVYFHLGNFPILLSFSFPQAVETNLASKDSHWVYANEVSTHS